MHARKTSAEDQYLQAVVEARGSYRFSTRGTINGAAIHIIKTRNPTELVVGIILAWFDCRPLASARTTVCMPLDITLCYHPF
jgi:hypothetical protein